MSQEIPNAAAVEIGQLAERMIKQYFAHHAAICETSALIS